MKRRAPADYRTKTPRTSGTPPSGYRIGWSGESESEQRAEARMAVIVTLTILVVFIILYTMFRSF